MPSKRAKYRRTVSMSGPTMVRLRRACGRTGMPIAYVVETMANRYCDQVGEPEVSMEEAKRVLDEKKESKMRTAAHWRHAQKFFVSNGDPRPW